MTTFQELYDMLPQCEHREDNRRCERKATHRDECAVWDTCDEHTGEWAQARPLPWAFVARREESKP